MWRMLIAAVLCLCAAVATAGFGLWLLTRPHAADPVRQVLRAVAPTQLAAAVMLTAGGVVALSARPQMPRGAMPKNMKPPKGAFKAMRGR